MLLDALTSTDISILAPSRERLPDISRKPIKAKFQSSLPHGSDKQLHSRCRQSMQFQSSLPHGSDIVIIRLAVLCSNFNPRSLTGATLVKIFGIFIITTFQSSLPHGSDVQKLCNGLFADISILAPSRERPDKLINKLYQLISILAPSRERRMQSTCQFLCIAYFNPRSLTGATQRYYEGEIEMIISILAPSRERPQAACAARWTGYYFNPRSLTGATRSI